jgi:hypothetical protein
MLFVGPACDRLADRQTGIMLIQRRQPHEREL